MNNSHECGYKCIYSLQITILLKLDLGNGKMVLICIHIRTYLNISYMKLSFGNLVCLFACLVGCLLGRTHHRVYNFHVTKCECNHGQTHLSVYHGSFLNIFQKGIWWSQIRRQRGWNWGGGKCQRTTDNVEWKLPILNFTFGLNDKYFHSKLITFQQRSLIRGREKHTHTQYAHRARVWEKKERKKDRQRERRGNGCEKSDVEINDFN